MAAYKVLTSPVKVASAKEQELPTHFIHTLTKSVMWRTADGWNRISATGTVSDRARISTTPESHPGNYTPYYGPFTITLGE